MENELFITFFAGGGAGGVASVTFCGCSLNNLYFDFFLGALLSVNELS